MAGCRYYCTARLRVGIDCRCRCSDRSCTPAPSVFIRNRQLLRFDIVLLCIRVLNARGAAKGDGGPATIRNTDSSETTVESWRGLPGIGRRRYQQTCLANSGHDPGATVLLNWPGTRRRILSLITVRTAALGVSQLSRQRKTPASPSAGCERLNR